MSKISIAIGLKKFTSKKEAKQFARDIVARYADNEVITGADDLFLRDLVALHHKAAQKVGCGISHFTVRVDSEWGKTRHFVIIRTDGEDTDVSWKECIDGTSLRRDVLSALRSAVAQQVISFKESAFRAGITLTCPYTNQILTKTNCHIDHMSPQTFEALAVRWMEQNMLLWTVIPLVDIRDNQVTCNLANTHQEASWRSFHQSNAVLRVISSKANLSNVKLRSGLT